MLVYHISQTLSPGKILQPDFDGKSEFCQPFIQALTRSEDCFYGMLLNGKYLYAILNKVNMREWSNYAKWATEAVFEFIRKTDFPDCYSRLNSNFFYDNLDDCQNLYASAWSDESEADRQKVRLFEIELDDPAPQKRDMMLYDEAFDAIADTQDTPHAIACARAYFSGKHTATPVWEIISNRPAKVSRDITEQLR